MAEDVTTVSEQGPPDGVAERLRAALSVFGVVAVWEWDIPGRRLIGDLGFASLHGLTTEEAAKGVNPDIFFSVIHPQDRVRIRLAVGGMLRGAEVFSKEYRLLLPNGSVRWVQARGRCHYDAQDRPARFDGALVDITEQKRVEEQLRIAQTAGGIGTFQYIDGFGTASVSVQFCHLLGLHPARDLPVSTINSLVHPEDAPIIDVAERLNVGTSSQVEFRITRADNGEVRWLTRRGEYLRDVETAGPRFSGVIYDITSAKRVEEQLRTLNETLEIRVEERTRERDRIWQVSRDLYVLCDRAGRCRSANPAWETELGYSMADLQGRRLEDFVHPDDRAAMEGVVSRLGSGEFVNDFDCGMLTKGGDTRSFSWTFVLEGEAFFAAGRDVTQRDLLEEQLRQAQKMEAVGQLTGGIAHDFNNLLTGIIGSLEIVQRRLGSGRQDVERFMEAASMSAQRAAALTHRLLAFSRRQSLDIRALDVNKLVASMEDLLHRTLGEQIDIVVELEVGLWPAFSDANQLESALLNLGINARDAMPEGGRLTIKTANKRLARNLARTHEDLAPGDYVAISVSDTGTGMSPEIVAKAFDPFFTTKPIGQGTGLGLSMIYGFAKQSGGHVRIESELGRGTTIKLYLPRLTSDDAAEPESPTGQVPISADGESVLVVEDDPAVRQLVVELLTELGYETIEATDGLAALPILESSRTIDLMVSDVGLPGMNGRQLADVARRRRPSLKVLFITGYAENASVRSDFLLHGMDMISKPFSVETLAVKVRDMLL